MLQPTFPTPPVRGGLPARTSSCCCVRARMSCSATVPVAQPRLAGPQVICDEHGVDGGPRLHCNKHLLRLAAYLQASVRAVSCAPQEVDSTRETPICSSSA